MSEKTFSVRFQSDELTRWMVSDERFAELLCSLCKAASYAQTRGPMPQVTVTLEQEQEEERR